MLLWPPDVLGGVTQTRAGRGPEQLNNGTRSPGFVCQAGTTKLVHCADSGEQTPGCRFESCRRRSDVSHGSGSGAVVPYSFPFLLNCSSDSFLVVFKAEERQIFA